MISDHSEYIWESISHMLLKNVQKYVFLNFKLFVKLALKSKGSHDIFIYLYMIFKYISYISFI